MVLKPLQRVLVPTGLFIALPAGYEAQVRPRSGLALKHGITVLNTPGTIDADYRGEIKVILVNLSNEPFEIVCEFERPAGLLRGGGVVARHHRIRQPQRRDQHHHGHQPCQHTLHALALLVP